MESAADVIRRLRDAKQMSQEDVALALRVTPGTVSQYENGRISPRRATAVKLDKLLDADGEILRALGYVTPTVDDSVIDTVLERLDQLEQEIRSTRDEMLDAVNRTSERRDKQIVKVEKALLATTEAVEALGREVRDSLPEPAGSSKHPSGRKHMPASHTPHSGVARR